MGESAFRIPIKSSNCRKTLIILITNSKKINSHYYSHKKHSKTKCVVVLILNEKEKKLVTLIKCHSVDNKPFLSCPRHVWHLTFPLPTFKDLVSSPRRRSSAVSLSMVLNTLNSPRWWHYLHSHDIHTRHNNINGVCYKKMSLIWYRTVSCILQICTIDEAEGYFTTGD